MLYGEASPFFIPKSLLLEFSLPYFEDGTEIDEFLLKDLQHINDCYLCRKKGLDLLARREHSIFELRGKLIKRKFSAQSITNAIEYLVSKNFLSEKRFCENFISSRIKKSEGKYLILQRLHQKGISSSLSNKVYEENIDFDIEKGACIISLKKIRFKYDDKQIIKDKLLKKGFSNSIIRECFDEIY